MKKISFYSYRNSDYVRLVVEVLLICKAFAMEVLESISIAGYYQELQARDVQLGLALDKNRKNPYTQPVADADLKRDDALDAFKYFLLYCTRQSDETIREEAGKLVAVLQTFGWSMQTESYSEQTKNARSFIMEVEKRPKLTAALETCLCVELFERVKTTQADFEVQMNAFNNYDTAQRDIDPIREKAWVRETMSKLVEDLNYHCRKQTNAECQQISDQLETVVNRIASEVKARVTRAMAEEE